jgi:Pvc16 N-terminal domain
VDRAVERFLRQEVPLDEGAVDVSFETPDRAWGAGLTRPAVNAFLFEVIRDPNWQPGGMQERQGPTGVERRQAPPVVQLHYLITTWANEYRDEHQLLGSVLEAVLAHSQLPADVLPDRLVGTRCGLQLASREGRPSGDFWSALDGRLKPGVPIEVSLPVEAFGWQSTAAEATSVNLATERLPSTPSGHDATPSGGDAEPGPVLRRRRANGALVMEGRSASKPEGT